MVGRAATIEVVAQRRAGRRFTSAPALRASYAFAILLVATLALPATASVEDEQGPEVPVVIAYLESGINPYHEDFRAPDWTEHPSTFIPGYPEDAIPLHLSLEAPTLEQALEQDAELWADTHVHEQLYYIPGTRIVGMVISTLDQGAPPKHPAYGRELRDHATATASAGSGTVNGIAPESAIVAISGGANWFTNWLYRNPWVDLATISQACLGGVWLPPGVWMDGSPLPGWDFDMRGFATGSWIYAETGHIQFVGAGNSPKPGTFCDVQGPPWHVRVGMAQEPEDSYMYAQRDGSGLPYDFGVPDVGYYAEADSFDGYQRGAGSSMSSPRAAGFAARLIQEARTYLGDERAFRDGAFAIAPPGATLPAQGPLADGRLTRDDVLALMRNTASYEAFGTRVTLGPVDAGLDPRPVTDRYWTKGYGLFWEPQYEHALRVMKGLEPLPDRSAEDRERVRYERVAGTYWEPLVCQDAQRSHFEAECWGQTHERNEAWLEDEFVHATD